MNTPLTANLLQAIMDLQAWTQHDLAARSSIHRATIGQHLNGTRPIRDEHLRAYLVAVPAPDAPRLLSAWLHDLLADDNGSEILRLLLDHDHSRLRETVSEWSPELTPRQIADLNWWSANLPADPDLDSLLETITRRVRGGS